MTAPPLRVLFLCTGNAARSQLAEALVRQLSNGRIAAFSAGSMPQPQLHPMTVSVLRDKFGIDASQQAPKPLSRLLDQPCDDIITVCDRAAGIGAAFPGDPERIHWSFADPAAVDADDAQRRAFEHVAGGLANRIRLWMALPRVRERVEGIQPAPQ